MSGFESEDHLQDFLEAHGVSTKEFGTGTAKSLKNLLEELRDEACFLQVQTTTPEMDGGTGSTSNGRKPQILRIVEPVFIRLRWRGSVLVQDSQTMTDGRRRSRKMLLAEKKEPRDGGGAFSTVLRAINEELEIPMEELRQEGVLLYRPDTYHFEIEQIDSPSYPGLTSVYRTHHVQVDILESGVHVFERCGLPECASFVTTEKSKRGTMQHFWSWYDVEQALLQKVVTFPPQALSSTSLANPAASDQACAQAVTGYALTKADVPDEETLRMYLTAAGIDCEKYDVGKAKSIKSLLKEVHGGESILEWSADTSTIRRIVEPVFIQLHWNGKVLVESEQRFYTGKVRQRNMLVAEKKSPDDQDIQFTTFRGLQEELSIPVSTEELEGLLRFMQEAYCCMVENLESASYPQLPCVYVTHYCSVQLTEAAIELFDSIGYLGDEFEAAEEDKINKWIWVDIQEARNNKVKGFPTLLEQTRDAGSGSNPIQAMYEPLYTLPSDPAGLRILLEAGGVNVSAWGTYTATTLQALLVELASGASHLERDAATGKIRRVMQSAMLQLTLKKNDERDGGFMESTTSLKEDSPNCGSKSCTFASMGETRELVQARPDLSCFEVQHIDVASYPGLPCCHRASLVQFDQRTEDQSRRGESTSNSAIDTVSRKGGGAASVPDARLPVLLSEQRPLTTETLPKQPLHQRPLMTEVFPKQLMHDDGVSVMHSQAFILEREIEQSPACTCNVRTVNGRLGCRETTLLAAHDSSASCVCS